jgi:hypothetical protein
VKKNSINWGLVLGAMAGLAVVGGGVLLLQRRQSQEGQEGVTRLYPGGSPGFYTGGMPVLKREEPREQPTDYLSDWRKINPQPMPVLIPESEQPQSTETTKIQIDTMPVLTPKTASGLLERVAKPMPVLIPYGTTPEMLERVIQPVFRRII